VHEAIKPTNSLYYKNSFCGRVM